MTCSGIQRKLIDLEFPGPNKLAEEFYPIDSASPLGKEERRARLAGQKMDPLPQLPAQNPVEPASTESATITVLRPGESHKVYDSHDVLGSVPEKYALVVERAAHWCGVGDEVIYAVVERFERRLLRWKKDRFGKDLAGSESELENSGEGEG